MKQSPGFFKIFIANFLGILFILFIIVALTCLFKFLYFPSKPKAVPERIPADKFSETIDQPAGLSERFHLLDQTVYSDAENAPICLQCHGNFCHAKSKELRSFYNMHSFYLACETCHVRKKEGEKIVFKWFDDKTGEAVQELKGKDENYHAKVVPVKEGERLDEFPQKELALEYMKHKDTYTEDEKKKIQDEIMKHVSKEAVTCEECHKRDGYINFSALGYKQDRVNELIRLEIIKLINEYEEFFIPTMFDPSVMGKPREES